MTVVVDHKNSLVELLEGILGRLVEGFTEYEISLPERQYWTLTQPAGDCEQLVVFFNQAYIGPPGDEASEPQRCNSPRTAQIDIQLLRCIPGMQVGRVAKPPTAEQIQAASVQQAIDTWVLLDLACSLDMWNDPMGGQGGLGVIATVDAGEPNGGLQGPTMHLTVAIP